MFDLYTPPDLEVYRATLGTVVAVMISFALTAIRAILTPTPTVQGPRDRDVSINPLQPIPPRSIVYGFTKVSGPFGFIEATNNKKYLHCVYLHAGHEITEYTQLIYDEKAEDRSGGISSGPTFPNAARISEYLGTDMQAADPNLVNEVEKWTNAHQLKGIAYSYHRFVGTNLPEGRIPGVSYYMKGKKVLDPRDQITKFTINPALILRDYLTDTRIGLGLSPARIIDSYVIAAANICEELVTVIQQSDDFQLDDITKSTLSRTTKNIRWFLGDVVTLTTTGTLPANLATSTEYYIVPVDFMDNGSGKTTFRLATSFASAMAGDFIVPGDAGSGVHTVTRTKEPRYACSGFVTTDEDPADVIRQILSTMSGKLIRTGTEIVIKAGAWEVPDVTFTDSDVVDSIVVQGRQDRQQIANGVKGTFHDPYELFEPTDFPAVTDAGATAEDGGQRIWKDVDLKMTASPSAAQRIAKIDLATSRKQIGLRTRLKMTGIKTRGGDIVIYDDADLNMSNQSFEVTDWTLAMQRGAEDSPLLSVVMALKELDSSVFDFTSQDEIEKPIVVPAEVPGLGFVEPPGEITLASGVNEVFITGDGTASLRLRVDWIPSDDAFVISHHVQWKLSSDTEWSEAGVFPIPQTEILISGLTPGENYDVRVRAINRVGAFSDFSVKLDHAFGVSIGPPAALQGLTISAIGGSALLRWDKPSEVDVLVGGQVIWRHSSSFTTDEVEWATATGIGQAAQGNDLIAVVPLKPGTYLGRVFNRIGDRSDVAKITTKQATVLTFNAVTSVAEDPDWFGEKDLVVVDDINRLKLDCLGLWDEIQDLDTDVEDVDSLGGVAPSGYYQYFNGIDLTTVSKTRLTLDIEAVAVSVLDLIDSRLDPIDDWPEIDSFQEQDADAIVQVSATDDDPSGSETAATDKSASAHTLTFTGGALISPLIKKLGTGALELDGSGDYVTAPDSADWHFTGPFTVHGYIRLDPGQAGNGAIVGQWGDDGSTTREASWLLRVESDLSLAFLMSTDGAGESSRVQTAAGVIIHNLWQHVAVTRDANNLVRLFLAGIQRDFLTVGSLFDSSEVLSIGARNINIGTLTDEFFGHIDQLEVIKGRSLWPPST